MRTNCNCPDTANPCKHIASVYYILSEKFDEDPFLLFELRGMQKEPLLELLRKQRATGKKSGNVSKEKEEEKKETIKEVVEKKLTLQDVENYWGHKMQYEIPMERDSTEGLDILQKLTAEREEKNIHEGVKILKELRKVVEN